MVSHLGVQDLLWADLAERCLKPGSTNVILESGEVELAR
jgi:hypothetical protein